MYNMSILPIRNKKEDRYLAWYLARKEKRTLQRTAALLNCSLGFVVKWIKRIDEGKDVCDNQRAGRPKVTTSKVDHSLVSHALSFRSDSSRQHANYLQQQYRTSISARTIRRRFCDEVLKWAKPYNKKILNEVQ